MSLTRKMLKAMGIEDEKIDQIIEAHSETVDALKEEIDRFKKDAEKVAVLQKELDEANEIIEKNGKDSYKVKYEAIKEEFDSYKNDIVAKETKSAKTKAFKQLLKDAGVSEKRIDSVVKVSNVDEIELDADGKVVNADKLTKSIKEEWSDFIQTTSTQGASTAQPPANNGGKTTKTKEEIMQIKDPALRQKAIAENPTEFGL